ncbi:unnamed protein product [Hymenolepis diminuta]|uniref:RAD51_interact domain-containing protein n=1 Tax=Hymenolepis diminuta TaxID=6216 RepID=A0A0R3SQS2_HYMDI|nr:unnamed protein product [Hymenolepis diminuta]VUZ40129.1 unnamed protein product [Hymenolepis diminuta]
MASPRKSVRKCVNISYASLLDDESDNEFFHDRLEIKPLKKKRTADSDSEEFNVDSHPSSPPKKQKAKKVVNPSTRNRKSVKDSTQLVSKPIQLTPQPLSREPLVTATKICASPSINPARSTFSEINTESSSLIAPVKPFNPSTPLTKTPTSFYVTPSSGLRIGLSRKNITKPLHPNVRLSNR